MEFSKEALGTLLNSRQATPSSPESGGMLVGRLILDSEDMIIDTVTTPTIEDQQGRFFYRRAKKVAQKIINRFWEESDHTVNYLGEWHTHPEAVPSPSTIDLENWRQITRIAQYEQSHLFFVIVGIEEIKAWESNKTTGKIDEMLAYDLSSVERCALYLE